MRVCVLAGAVSLVLVSWVHADPAVAAIRRMTNIPPEPLARALKVLAKDRKFQVLFRAEVVRDINTSGAVGDFTPDEALKQLLSGTGLTFRYLDDRTVTVVQASAASSEDDRSTTGDAIDRTHVQNDAEEAGKTASQDFRVAQMDQASAASPGPPIEGTGVSRSPGGEAITLEEVVVTAQKREQRLVDVPISILALGSEELARREVFNLDQLGSVVPGLAVQSGPNRRITLRGVSNIFGNASLIGIYLDEADVTSVSAAQLDLNTYDLERVEVLRGPQGTLYGEGSAGGAVRLITRDPRLDNFEAAGDIAGIVTHGGSPSERMNAVINVPVVTDQLGFRLAGSVDHEGGWIDQPAAGQININSENLFDVRLKGLWVPVSELRVSALAEVHRNRRSTNAGEDANGDYTQAFGFTTIPRVLDDHEIYNLTLTYDFSWARLLSSTSYVRQANAATDYTAILPLSPTGTPFLSVYVLDDPKQIRTATQEIRLTSVDTGPWQWLAGAFYRHFRFDENETGAAGFDSPLIPIAVDNSTRSNAWAVFTDTSYRLTEHITGGVGLRYYNEEQDHNTGPASIDQSARFTSTSPRAYLQYRFTNDFNVYANAAKGFRSGGFNAVGQAPYDPETVRTYELGTKASLLENRLNASAGLFYSDYTNYQVNGLPLPPAPQVPVTSNAGSARVKGIEWDFAWHPIPQWTFGINGDYATSRFYQINATSTAYQVGDPLDLFPKYQLTVSAERDWKWNGKSGFLRLDYSRQGRETYRDRSNGPWYLSESDVIDLLNFNLGLEFTRGVTVGVYGQNLLNDRGYTDPFAIERTAARTRPRTFGLELSAAVR
jgi:iron complex outermembrane receptor protein